MGLNNGIISFVMQVSNRKYFKHDPYYLLDIFITSSHHRMTCILLRVCHVLSLRLTSPLSIYINDKPRVWALSMLGSQH